MTKAVVFNEETIARLFGHEAAEDETPQRLREYYFKSAVFEQVNAALPLRILVGHKGIGKSALFQVAMAEDRDANKLALEVRPDDVAGIGSGGSDLLSRISQWKDGLRSAILRSSLRAMNAPDCGLLETVKAKSANFVHGLADILQPAISSYADSGAVKRAALDNFLAKREINVYIDDLDRGWAGKRDDIERLSALLNAVRDLSRDNTGLRFRISMRSDVFFLVRTSDESTDKLQGSVIWYSWTNHQILALLVKRVESFFGRQLPETQLLGMSQTSLAQLLSPVLDERFNGQGKWQNAPMYRVLMSLIRRRPRDLIKLLTLAARRAAADRRSRIQTVDMQGVFEQYSQDRVQDTVNEYRSELPTVERLILGMKPNRKERTAREGYLYKTDKLLQKLNNIREGGEFTDAIGRMLSAKQLAGFLYKINFLIASKELPTGFIDRKYFEENKYLSSDLMDFGYDWEVHPAYRWALQPDSAADLPKLIGLSAED